MLLVNNVLLVVAMLAVLLGTLYPLFIDALNAGRFPSDLLTLIPSSDRSWFP